MASILIYRSTDVGLYSVVNQCSQCLLCASVYKGNTSPNMHKKQYQKSYYTPKHFTIVRAEQRFTTNFLYIRPWTYWTATQSLSSRVNGVIIPNSTNQLGCYRVSLRNAIITFHIGDFARKHSAI